jgi:hypothetical protein
VNVDGAGVMQSLMENTGGLRMMINLNFDRLLYALTLAVALGFGAWLGTIFFPG